MRIAYIIDGMYNSAGRERVVANKANYLSRMGHEITVLTTDQKGRPSYYPLPEDVKMIDLGINYDEYYGKGIINKLVSHRQKSHLFRERLSAFLEAHPQDVVVALMDRYVPTIISLAGKSVTVYEHHFNKFAMYDLRESRTKHLLQQIVYRVKDWLYTRFYYRKLDIFAVLTEEDKAYWGSHFRNIVCMPNSITYRENEASLLESKIAISVGRLTYQKGYDRLIKIWRNIEPLQPEWQLHIYGNGEDKEKLVSMIEDFGLKNVRIFAPTPSIENKLLEASFYVMTSRFEGLPMVLLEAMAVGLPLVSFDCKCGPRDIIDDGKNGFLIPDGDFHQMEQRMCSLMNDEIIRKKQGLESKMAASKYSHEVIMNEWTQLFNIKKQAKKMKNIYAFLNNCNPYNSIFQQTMLLKERLEHIYGIRIPVLNRKELMMHLNRKDDLILLPYDSLKLELLSPLLRFNNVVFIYHNITPAHFFWKTEPLVAMRAIAGRLQLRYLKYVTTKWIAVSEYNKKELENIGFQDVTLCSNLIKCSKTSGEKTSEPSLLYVGRIVQNKRCLELLDIAKNVAEKLGRPISLYIVGNGKPGTSYLNKFTRKIQQLSSSQLNIHWLKGLAEEELSEVYNRCWIYITLSQHEGFGLPVCESINNGTPAIYTSCGGQECVLNNIGLVKESQIAGEAASLLTDATKLESLYTQQKKLIELFTIPNYDKEIERIFNKLI